MFCIECGREEELVGPLCKNCYAKKHAQASLPDHVDVTLCAHCSSMLTEKGWEDVGSIREAAEASIKQALSLSKDAKLSSMRVQLSEKDERNLEAKIDVLLSAEGHDFTRELGTIVRLKRGSCTQCSKKQGMYYEAILQVRVPGRSLDEHIEQSVEKLVKNRVESMRKGSREVFVSKIERVKGGLDFYFSTIPAARTIARWIQDSMCTEFKESSSLWGRRDGKDLYRMTYLVRFPGFGPGDVIEHEKKEYYVRSMSKGTVHAFDLVSGEERPIKLKEDACALVRAKAQILKAVVLTESKHELQILDPETMQPLDVKKPSGFRRDGEQVRLVKTKFGAFVLSDSW